MCEALIYGAVAEKVTAARELLGAEMHSTRTRSVRARPAALRIVMHNGLT